jgi:predicted amidohydrolase
VVAKAVEGASDLIVFPELHLSGYSIGSVDGDLSLRPDDPRIEKLARRAGPAGLLLGFVSPAPERPHTYNSMVFTRPVAGPHPPQALSAGVRAFEERNHFNPGRRFERSRSTGHPNAVLLCNDACNPSWPFLPSRTGPEFCWCQRPARRAAFSEPYDSREYWHDITHFYGRMFQRT